MSDKRLREALRNIAERAEFELSDGGEPDLMFYHYVLETAVEALDDEQPDRC